MNRVKVLREYNDFLKEKYKWIAEDGRDEFDANLLEFLEKTCVEVSEDEPIDRLDLSTRTRNVLVRGGVTTVGQLEKLSQTELMRIRNMGRKSLDEINEKLRQIKEQKNE